MASQASIGESSRSGAATNGVTKKEAGSGGQDATEDQGDRDLAYFQYYALLSHQAQMLQDGVRTTSYQRAILDNAVRCFQDKVVMDVGAGNGILSIFSVQAGARRVYAVEASQMVTRLQHLLGVTPGAANGKAREDAVNPWISGRILPVQSKMEDVTPAMLDGNDKVDTIVSECLGVLLVHERMCESFLDARDRFLKPGGTMLPSSGTICLAPIEDKVVWEEAATKARFWENRSFYGVDITPLAEAAWEESFSSPVVGCFGPMIVLAPSNDYMIDFQTVSQESLRSFTMPLSFGMTNASVVHGLAGWFDLHFLARERPGEEGSDAEMATGNDNAANGLVVPDVAGPDLASLGDVGDLLGTAGAPSFVPGAPGGDPSLTGSYMSTSPFATPTHWQQVRFLFREPLAVNRGQTIEGSMLCEVNNNRSYTLTATLGIAGSADPATARRCQWRLDRQVYSWTSAAPAPQ